MPICVIYWTVSLDVVGAGSAAVGRCRRDVVTPGFIGTLTSPHPVPETHSNANHPRSVSTFWLIHWGLTEGKGREGPCDNKKDNHYNNVINSSMTTTILGSGKIHGNSENDPDEMNVQLLSLARSSSCKSGIEITAELSIVS